MTSDELCELADYLRKVYPETYRQSDHILMYADAWEADRKRLEAAETILRGVLDYGVPRWNARIRAALAREEKP